MIDRPLDTLIKETCGMLSRGSPLENEIELLPVSMTDEASRSPQMAKSSVDREGFYRRRRIPLKFLSIVSIVAAQERLAHAYVVTRFPRNKMVPNVFSSPVFAITSLHAQTKETVPPLPPKQVSKVDDPDTVPVVLPYKIDDVQRISTPWRRQDRPVASLVVRHLEDDDLPSVVRMCVKEFGPSNPRNNNPLQRIKYTLSVILGESPLFSRIAAINPEDESRTSPESSSEVVDIPTGAVFAANYILAWILYLGLVSRIRWRIWGEERNTKVATSDSTLPVDHHVLCLADAETNQVVGIAEVSYQLPYQTAPVYVLPYSWKRMLSKFVYNFNLPINNNFGNNIDNADDLIRPYVSSVIINESFRGWGYGTLLMEAIERHAKDVLGCNELTLHVDANEGTGRTAQALYFGLGYRPIQDERKVSMLRLASSNKRKAGVYICDARCYKSRLRRNG